MQNTATHLFNLFLTFGVFVYAFVIVAILVLSQSIRPFLEKYSMYCIMAVSGIALLSSLIYSIGIGFPPCDLCWYQRIFIYPTFFMTLLAVIRKDSLCVIKPYLFLLTSIGAVISLYHNVVYYTGYSPLPCSATASCTARYVFEFGFVTIPLMALMSFVVILVFLAFSKKSD